MQEIFFVYILASQKQGTLYIGVTNNIIKRVHEHKNHLIKGFTEKYKVDILVHYEIFEDSIIAIQREKQLKEWRREWKIDLIEQDNPYWIDLYPDVLKKF